MFYYNYSFFTGDFRVFKLKPKSSGAVIANEHLIIIKFNTWHRPSD